MKDLLSKEHYCYKIHTILMKSSAYLLFYRQPYPPIWARSSFLQENFNRPPMIFQKSQQPYKQGGSHYEYYT